MEPITLDPRLADLLVQAGIVTSEQGDKLKALLEREQDAEADAVLANNG